MIDTYQILVADDDHSIVNIIETALKQAGYQVLTAYNGEDACRIINNRQLHLIIMDVMMPRCNGLIATMRIRQEHNIPILILSLRFYSCWLFVSFWAGFGPDFRCAGASCSEFPAAVHPLSPLC